MQTRYTDAIPLAPRPNLEQYRKLAKDLLKASRAADTAAIRQWAVEWIERLARLQHSTATPEYVDRDNPHELNWKHINEEVEGILNNLTESRPVASPKRAADPNLSEAQLVIARLHGFDSWPKFAAHIEALHHETSPINQFERVADAIVTGDLGTVKRCIRERPSIVHERSTRDHNATLLHYLAANGHEGFRQRTPKNAVDIARLLLEAGAAPDALAKMYDHECTTMEMLVSSVHPHAAGVQSALVDVLVDFGAAVDGVKNDGSPLMTALMFRYPLAAERLAARGATVDNVIAAAALGRADLVDRMVTSDGQLRPEVPMPEVPWPRLPKDPKVHLAHALTWACVFGRDDVVELLLEKGVDASSSDGSESALHAAAARGRLDVVRLLMDHGASLEAQNAYGGTVLDGTIWYALNSPFKSVDYSAVVRELVEMGARTDVYPELQQYVDAVIAGRRGGGYPS
jgi:hypothetical protein